MITGEAKETMSFNKRVSLVKKDVFEQLKETKELDNIKGSNTSGFYSLSTIEKYLNPALDKYDLDLDLEIFSDKIVGHWYDCQSEKQRDIEIDFHRIENVDKLQLMANMVQSEGAVKSYTRRYALTAILRLPSTDLIETGDDFRKNTTGNNSQNTGNGDKKAGQAGQNTTTNTSENMGTQQTATIARILTLAEKAKMGTFKEMLKAATTFGDFTGYTDVIKISDKVKTNLLKVISDEQVKRLMTIGSNKNLTDEQIKTLISKVWGKLSKKDLNSLEYDILVTYIQSK
jgi:hypothetical protein